MQMGHDPMRRVTRVICCGMIFLMTGEYITGDTTRSDQLVGEAEFLKCWNCSAESIAKAVADGTIFFVMKGGQKLYPSFFADLAYKRRQLAAVTKLLKDLDGFTKWQFFVTGKGSLGGLTPLAALRQGKLRQVKATATVFKVKWFWTHWHALWDPTEWHRAAWR